MFCLCVCVCVCVCVATSCFHTRADTHICTYLLLNSSLRSSFMCGQLTPVFTYSLLRKRSPLPSMRKKWPATVPFKKTGVRNSATVWRLSSHNALG